MAGGCQGTLGGSWWLLWYSMQLLGCSVWLLDDCLTINSQSNHVASHANTANDLMKIPYN